MNKKLKIVNIDSSLLSTYNDYYLTLEQSAKVWNLAMAKLGYTEIEEV